MLISGGIVSHLGGFVWSSLGSALAGTAGEPVLTGSGTLVAGTPTVLAVEHARPSTTSWMVIGSAQLGLPILGGTLVPFPDVVVGGMLVDANGKTSFTTPWPTGIPSGVALYYQFWILDPVGPQGVSATNGLHTLVR